MSSTNTIDGLLTRYRHFSLGELQTILASNHSLNISRRKLAMMSRRCGIYRRSKLSLEDKHRVKTLIKNMVYDGSAGYRAVWLSLKQLHNINISRNDVMELMRDVDLDGVHARTRNTIRRRQYSVPGPNYLWHIDGYDKLKKFGIAIHGCIDGYSRKLIWLEVGPTNNDPKVVGKYFLDSLTKLKGMPKIVRADHGTENVIIERLQTSVRKAVHESSHSFIYGKSCLNQRIERFWGELRKDCVGMAIEYLAELERSGIFSTANKVHIEAVRYCFMDVIRRMVDAFANHWNSHSIRKSSRAITHGKPDILYITGRNYLQPISMLALDSLKQYVLEVDDVDERFAYVADNLLIDWEETVTSTAFDDLNAARIKLTHLLHLINELDANEQF